MVELKTDKAKLEKERSDLLEKLNAGGKCCLITNPNFGLDLLDDGLVAHEILPEYDRMKAKIAEVMAMKPQQNGWFNWELIEDKCANRMLNQIKEIFEGGV